MTVTTYCELNELEVFLTLDEGEVTGVTQPDSQTLQRNIDMAASEVNMSLQASGQFTCNKSEEGNMFLKLLNIVGAMLLTEWDNARFLEQFDRTRYQDWKDSNLELLRTGHMELCEGETNVDYPAVATAEVGYTPEAMDEILRNYYLRNLS